MKKYLNVLSIDWDYFIDATEKQRIIDFPDGNDDLSMSVKNILWANRYSENSSIEKIGIRKDEYEELTIYLVGLIVNTDSCNISTMVTDSHKYIYDVISEKLAESDNPLPVKLFHIDYHPDYYEDGQNLHCGNWLNYLYKDLEKNKTLTDSEVVWMAREDSDENPDVSTVMRKTEYDRNTELYDTIEEFFNGHIPDILFLCKSNPWSPPHLDYWFDKLSEVVIGIGKARWSNDINNRYTTEFQDTIKEFSSLKRCRR